MANHSIKKWLAATLLLASAPLLGQAQEMTLECPILECGNNGLEDGVCYQHDGKASAKKIKGGLCYDVENAKQTDQVFVCPFNTDQYMWIDEILQGQERNEINMLYRDTSQVEKRKKIAQCKDASYLKSDLNPGRSCTVASQCKSRNCQEVCVGFEQNDACYTHSDCVEGFYCHDTDEWPFKSVCKPYREGGDVCTEDFQCQITHFCWFQSKEDKVANTKKCMETYSQENGIRFGWHQESEGRASLGEFTQNGKYCKTGLAFQADEHEAICTKTDTIMFDNVVTNDPYNCTATDPNKRCQIVYEQGTPNEGFVEVFCRCSMSNQDRGFCESVIGTETFEKAVRAKKLLYRESKCHTLDRENMRAQRDSCGIGEYTDEWRFAVDKQFNVTHWPYIQDNQIYHCVQKFFSDSYVNESLDGALSGRFAGAAVLLGAMALQLFTF